jgi:hypothetical protein
MTAKRPFESPDMSDEDRDFYRWYGPWRPLTPRGLARVMRQLWVRRDGYSPWLFDLAMNPHDGDTWISARHEQVRMPIAEATYVTGGISYLQPEIVMWMKAHRANSKDERDVAEILPRLQPSRIAWLRGTLEATHPGHRWLRLLAE